MITILMSNLGYMRGINGELGQHLRYAHRNFYCSVATQQKSLRQLGDILDAHDPDLCCFVEIDKGSSDSANFNQLDALVSPRYPHFDIENKYGAASPLRSYPFSRGKSNAFLSKQPVAHEKLYFTHGTKRLIYKLSLNRDITVFFAHFSLKKAVRVQQLLQMRQLLHATPGHSILLGDLRMLNDENSPTFTFHRTRKVLDLCICSEALAEKITLHVIPQPFSDHDALLLHVNL
jgi:endonuclease/exonuclease/phosphatase family metal-dependent hydrolase